MTRPMSMKQRRFLEAYVGEAKGNATLAARIAGYKGSESTLRAVASRVLHSHAVSAELEAYNAETRTAALLAREEILTRLTAIARGEGDEPHVLQSGETVYAPPKFSDRLRALELAAKLQGLLVDKVEVKVAAGIQVQLVELQGKMPAEAFEALLVALAEEEAA